MDVQYLLESNARPSEEQESYLLERLSSLDSSISTLDSKIAQAQEVLDELDSKHAKLIKKKKFIAAVISPYRRLPVDVWVEIVKFAVWSGPVGASNGVESGKDIHLLSLQLNTNVYKPTGSEETVHWPEARQLSTLTRVCKDWRHILHSAAIFWCTLELHIYSNDHNIDGFAPKMETWLARSGQLPWSLKILSSKRQLHAPAFASFLLRNCDRWKELSLYMHDLDVLAPLFYLEPSATGPEISCRRSQHGRRKEYVWTNLQVLSLDGWFTDSPRVQPFTLLDNMDFLVHDYSHSLHPPAIRIHGTMPALRSLTIDTPCHKVQAWKWIPWAQLSDVDLRTGDQYEGNIAMLSKCSDALEMCSIEFAPSLRLPLDMNLLGQDIVQPVVHGIANLLVTGLDGVSTGQAESEDEAPQRPNDVAADVLHLGGLKDLTLKKIGYLCPLISRLCVPALQKLFISMCPINEPEPYLGASLIDLLERSGAAIPTPDQSNMSEWSATSGDAQSRITTHAAAGPPLTYFTLALENTRRRQMSTPAITNAEYLGIFERTEKLKILHVKDYSTDARFLEKLNQRGMLPALTTISFVVAADGQVPERFDEFVKLRMDRLD